MSNNKFDSFLIKELQKPQWIIDRNYNRTSPIRIEHCVQFFILIFKQFIAF